MNDLIFFWNVLHRFTELFKAVPIGRDIPAAIKRVRSAAAKRALLHISIKR